MDKNFEISGKPAVSLIIACYNNWEFLEKIFYSLQNQSFSNFEIVIADDGSGAEMANLIARYTNCFSYPVQHIWHDDKGFRKTIIANNAVWACKANYLVFIDGDCILHHRFIERHYKRREAGVVLSGRRIMLDESISNKLSFSDISGRKFEKPQFWWQHTNPNGRKRGFYLPCLYKILNYVARDYWAFGSNFSVHKSDFIAINGYDESIIGRGLEDINLSSRFKLIGFRTKRLTYEALQYHLYHRSDPVPHNNEAARAIASPENFFAPKGINRLM